MNNDTFRDSFIVLNNSNQEYLVSNINIKQKLRKLRHKANNAFHHIKKRLQEEENLIQNLDILVSRFPNLKVRDQHYLYTDEVNPLVNNVELIMIGDISVYASPFVRINKVKIHSSYCNYYVAFKSISQNSFLFETSHLWRDEMLKNIGQHMIDITDRVLAKFSQNKGWYFKYNLSNKI